MQKQPSAPIGAKHLSPATTSHAATRTGLDPAPVTDVIVTSNGKSWTVTEVELVPTRVVRVLESGVSLSVARERAAIYRGKKGGIGHGLP